MQQRQPRLGDVLDDYCPRERRLTNHVVVAMIGDTVKQTRCTTCDADHEYKHAAMPRPRKKPEQSALYSQVLANVTPKRVAPMPHLPEHDVPAPSAPPPPPVAAHMQPPPAAAPRSATAAFDALFDLPEGEAPAGPGDDAEEAPAHRRLIRAQLPRIEGQPPAPRQAPDFTIRQPSGGGRPGRFRPRGPRPGQSFQGGGQNGNVFRQGQPRGGGGQRQPSGRSPMSSHTARRQGGGGKRSK